MKKPRIYADFHGIICSHRNEGLDAIVLDGTGTLRELSNAGIVLKEGMKLIVYTESDDTEDLEHDVELYFCTEDKNWHGEVIGELRNVPIQNPQSPSPEFNCVSCQHKLVAHIKNNGLQRGDTCPNCGI